MRSRSSDTFPADVYPEHTPDGERRLYGNGETDQITKNLLITLSPEKQYPCRTFSDRSSQVRQNKLTIVVSYYLIQHHQVTKQIKATGEKKSLTGFHDQKNKIATYNIHVVVKIFIPVNY